ncbi:MAG: inositol monophosphatase family protein [Chloroflexota bacterium]
MDGRGIELSDELAFALNLADLADAISLTHFRSDGLAVETKADASPVTVADRAIEQAIRARVAAERPGHRVVGEEYGSGEGSGPCWIIDPIDGTKKFVRGIEQFATLIALEQGGEIVLGVASAPAMRRRWWAARGLGAYADGRPIRVSGIAELRQANVLVGGIEGWARTGRVDQLGAIAGASWATGGMGDFWIHLLVAEGSAEAAIETEAAVWDVAALKVIVEEAGGRFSDLAGDPGIRGGNALSTNGLLHADLLARLQSGAQV